MDGALQTTSDDPDRRQTTDTSEENNIGPYDRPVIKQFGRNSALVKFGLVESTVDCLSDAWAKDRRTKTSDIDVDGVFDWKFPGPQDLPVIYADVGWAVSRVVCGTFTSYSL